MLFNSIEFVIFFFSVFLLVWVIKNRDYQYLLLLVASYFFYFYSSKAYILLFFLSSLSNFYLGKALFSARHVKVRRLILYGALAFNILLLGFFKYADFSIIIVNDLSALFGHALNFSLLHILLPIGISFYTFEAMSYVLDIHYGKIEPEKSLLHFLLFLAFFPKLIAGPIMRASEFLPQIKNEGIKIRAENIKSGITVMMWGFFKKIVIADNIAFLVDAIFHDPASFHSSLPILIGAFAFGIQVYCDFSGYCDIAIGAAKCFGLDLSMNFNKPYLSKNPAEFWRRWHMSLSSWIRDYIYSPLYVFFSGRKFMKKISDVTFRTKLIIYLANIIALFFMGIWHGAYWNFVIFGIYCGLLLVSYHILVDLNRFAVPRIRRKGKEESHDPMKDPMKDPKKGRRILGRFGALMATFMTFYVMMFGFMMFRITNLNKLSYALRKYVQFDFHMANADWNAIKQVLTVHPGAVFAIMLFALVYFMYFFSQDFNPKERLKNMPLMWWTVSLSLMLLAIIIMLPSKSGVFIYFQF